MDEGSQKALGPFTIPLDAPAGPAPNK